MNKEELKKRVLSFLWRLLGMAAVASLAFVSQNLELVNVSPAIIGLVGLIVNEATKQLNNAFSLDDKIGGALRRLAGR